MRLRVPQHIEGARGEAESPVVEDVRDEVGRRDLYLTAEKKKSAIGIKQRIGNAIG